MASKGSVILYIFLVTFTYAEGYGYGSCHYKCGGYSSDCSCDYNCWTNGNCCNDFCEQCSYMSNGYCDSYLTSESTSATVIPETTGPAAFTVGSCRYNCGRYSSGCSCDHNCVHNGNCCPDFCYQCPYINSGYCGYTTTETSTTSGFTETTLTPGMENIFKRMY
ncbi:poly(U)-specific endoribonuclease-like [Chiloscyllium plagiosum]|uniref:poly(U)-specific endoribonuclease-like n=1 Tax=Chiloscyllium plagiosum TaxID=36176 RepID=UPI001CB883A0|nr:poly(U)-specific endoribonuclease-like [Chiloscyllium plagiosum]